MVQVEEGSGEVRSGARGRNRRHDFSPLLYQLSYLGIGSVTARPYGTFGAMAGDNVTIEIYAYKYHQNATIKVSNPNVFTTQ